MAGGVRRADGRWASRAKAWRKKQSAYSSSSLLNLDRNGAVPARRHARISLSLGREQIGNKVERSSVRKRKGTDCEQQVSGVKRWMCDRDAAMISGEERMQDRFQAPLRQSRSAVARPAPGRTQHLAPVATAFGHHATNKLRLLLSALSHDAQCTPERPSRDPSLHLYVTIPLFISQ